ncbi:MAG TPA: aldo/keto reductase [Pseudonocardiaceae bacterium]
MIRLALAFTLAHAAVSATIIGPRTLEQLESQLPAADLRLDDETLDAINRVVPAGETISRADIAYEPQAIRHVRLRRRSGG